MLLIASLALIRSLPRNSLLRNVSERSALTEGLTLRIDYSALVQARLLSRSVSEIFDDTLRPLGISSVQFVLLSVIGQKEPVTRSQIARLQHLDKSTLTRNLKKIFSEGWIAEVRENADGRSRPIALTAAGKELLQTGQPAWVAAQARIEELLGKDSAIALITVAERLVNAMERSSMPARDHDLALIGKYART
jgi:DNA-binding MarR family transcriptional regulator